MVISLQKNDSHFGILLISQSLYFQIMANLNIGWVAWAEARNNKVVIATRLCFTKSLHILSLLNAKVVCVFSAWKRIETEIDVRYNFLSKKNVSLSPLGSMVDLHLRDHYHQQQPQLLHHQHQLLHHQH